MKKRIITVFLVFTAISANLKGQVMNTLVRDFDVATMGLAGVSVPVDAGAFATDNNAAAMSLSDKRMIAGASYAVLQPASVRTGTLSAAGFVRLSDKIAIGAGFKSLAYDAYPVTSEEGRSTEEFKPKEFAVNLGMSYRIISGFSAGLNIKYASFALGPKNKKGLISVDLSAFYTADNINAGLNVRNIGSQTMDIRAGGAYKLGFFLATAQAEYLTGAGVMGALGVQYSIKEMVYLRVGLHIGNASKSIPTFGSVGLGLQIFKIKADVCYQLSSASIGNSLALGLSYSF